MEYWLYPALALLFGLAIGSFLNVVIHRLPKMMERDWARQCAEFRNEEIPETPRYDLALPASACPNCGHAITALENIPILSWLYLRAKCSACKAPISVRYPLVELTTGLLFLFCLWHFGANGKAIAAMLFGAAMIALTMIDFDTTLLPDDITLPLLWVGVLLNTGEMFTTLPSAVFGAVAGYLALWSVYWGFKLLTGKEGMGYGDFKLLAAIGAWLGWEMLPQVILLSSVMGAVVGGSLMLFRKHGRDIPIPFGPYLASAGLIALFWGEALNRLYWQLGRV